MGSHHLKKTTATEEKVATKGTQTILQYGKPATAEVDSNSREGSNNGTQTVWEASNCRGWQQWSEGSNKVTQTTEPVLLNVYGAPELIPRNEFRQPM